MRQLLGCCSVVVFACACSGNNLPLAPTPTASAPALAPTPTLPLRDSGNWTPFFFARWQPGIGTSLGLNATIAATVEMNELCIPDIYWQWGGRACKQFVVIVPSDGWLHAYLRWDSSASGLDPKFTGEVVLIAPTGRFAVSDWQQTTDTEVFAKVEPGPYDIMVIPSVDARFPFQLRAELRPN
jgi:hypothetical protein